MRRSEFNRAVEDEFGLRGDALVVDLVLPGVGGRTAAEALRAGVPPREVWLALCRIQEVPPQRWHGAGRPVPPRG